LAVPFLDELASGIAPASAPDIAASLGISGGATAGAVIVAFHSLAFFVEAPLLAWSERVSPRWFSVASLGVVALSAFMAAASSDGAVLLLALAVYGPASGCALAVAEGVLVEENPGARERTMARLSLAANAGDLAVPALLALFAACGYGWRAVCVAAGLVAVALAILHARARSLDRRSVHALGGEADSGPSIREALAAAFGTRPLLGWSVACALTNLLDEVLVAFGAVQLHAIGVGAAERSWAIAAWVVGGFVGIGAVDHFVERVGSRRFLLVSSSAAAVGVAVLAATRSHAVAIAALFFVGVAGSTLHPLTKARSYAAFPGRPALVNAIASGLLVLDMAAPVVLGLVAARAGPAWAIAGLLVAPFGVIAAALADRPVRPVSPRL
jgi:MFS transporter, DHA1 family, inner membrane transport protein